MNKAVFIDKDGTLIKDVPYNVDPALIALEKYAGKALQLLRQNNYHLIVISNQPGVAKGFFSEDDLEKVSDAIRFRLSDVQAQPDAFYYCPHLENGAVEKYSFKCNCRKPKPGLLLEAANDLNIDVKQSWMIGDILNDIEAGNDAGCRTILIDNGNETEWMMNEKRIPGYTVKDLLHAAEIIIETNNT